MLRIALGFIVLSACRRDAAIVADDGHAAAPAPSAAIDADVPGASEAGVEDACAPTETWDARLVVPKKWNATAHMNLPGPLQIVVPRLHLTKTLFDDCGMTGGGCGDCSKPYDPMTISCKLAADHVRVDVGIDDVGPTFVEVSQRGDTLLAEWTEGGMIGLPTPPAPTHRTVVVAKLPCSVKIRFVR